MTTLLYALIFAIARSANGDGYSRWVCSGTCGFLLYAAHLGDWWMLPLYVGLVHLLLVFGWGKYFAGFEGLPMNRREREFLPADVVAGLIGPRRDDVYSFVAMSVRWLLSAIPLLTVTLGLTGLAVSPIYAAIMGGCYWLAGRYRMHLPVHWVRPAEFATFFITGLLIV